MAPQTHGIAPRDSDEPSQSGRDESDLSFNFGASGQQTIPEADTASIYAALIRNADYGIIATSLDGTITVFSPGAEKILGYRAEEMVGRATPALFHDLKEVAERAERLSERVGRTIPPGVAVLTTKPPDESPADSEWTLIRKDGSRFAAQISVSPILSPSGATIGYVGVVADISERWEAEQCIQEYNIVLEFQKRELEKANEELAALVTIDDLTGLKNQRFFRERIAEEVSRAQRYDTPLTLILLDVDRFKKYNDTFGHTAGDDVLRTLGHLLRQNARETDIAARYGGEEFALLLPQTELASAEVIAERLRASVEAHAWTERPITISLGVAAWTRRMIDVRGLVDCADTALYASKAKGRNSVSSAPDAPNLAPDPDQSLCTDQSLYA